MVLLLIVTCSLVLPLIISIYRSSNVEGNIQQAANRSTVSEAVFGVIGASESDLAKFQDVDGLRAEYADGQINLYVVDSAKAYTQSELDGYSYALWNRMHEVNQDKDEKLALLVSSSKSNDALDVAIRQNSIMMHIVGLVLMFVALLIIVSSYNDHLKVFANDISKLRLIGATKLQVGSIFMIEFLVVFIISFVLASLISIGIMYVVVNKYIGIQDDSSLSWLIFHVDLREFALIGVEFCVATATIFFFRISKFVGNALSAQPEYDASGTKLKRYNRLPQKRHLAHTLGAIVYQRTGGQIRRMLFAIIPSLIVVVFLFAFITAEITMESVPPENDIVVKIQIPYRKDNAFTGADIAQMMNIDGVKSATLAPSSSSSIHIDLSDNADNVAVQNALEKLYPGTKYSISNLIRMYERSLLTTPGYFIMIIALSALVLLFITVVVYVKLYGYLETQRKNIASFYELGASKSVISGAFQSIARKASMLCIAVSFIIGMGLHLLFLIMNDHALMLHPQVVLFLAAVAAIIFSGFHLPVHQKLKSILK
jgi:hypothetical protein